MRATASAILLAATNHGLATTPLSRPLEIVETRDSISAQSAATDGPRSLCSAWAGRKRAHRRCRPPPGAD